MISGYLVVAVLFAIAAVARFFGVLSEISFDSLLALLLGGFTYFHK